MWARRRRRLCAEPGPRCPGKRGTRPQHPRSGARGLGPGRALPQARPRSSLSTRSSPGFPRVSRLPAGRAGALKFMRRLAGAWEFKQGSIPLPPVAASPLGPRVFLLSAPDAEPRRPWPAPQVVRESKPHAKHLQGGRPDPRVPASVSAGAERIPCTSAWSTPAAAAGAAAVSAPPGLPLARPLLRPLPPPPRPAAGRGARKAPRARCVSWTLRLLPGGWADPGLDIRSAAPECRNLRGAAAFFRVGASRGVRES